MSRAGAAIAILVSLMIGACDVDDIWQAGIQRGSVKDGVYSNQSLRFKTNVPVGWKQVSDSALDIVTSNLALQEKRENPDSRTVKILFLCAFLNPSDGSCFSLECWPAFLNQYGTDLKEYAEEYAAQRNTAFFEKGSDCTVKVEWLNADDIPAVKFTTDESTPERTSINIEVVRFRKLQTDGSELVIRQSALLRDSTELPLVDSLFTSYREMSILG